MARRRGNKKGHNIIIIATPCNPSLPLPTPPPLAALSPLPVKHTLSLVYHGNHSICPKQTQRHSRTEIKTTCLIKGSTILLLTLYGPNTAVQRNTKLVEFLEDKDLLCKNTSDIYLSCL